MKRMLSLIVLLSAVITAQTQTTWLGRRTTNTAMFLDPTEVQMSGSITALVQQNASEEQYIPFGFGGAQSIVSKELSETKNWEIITEFGVFTQFEWTTIDGEQQRNLLNTDYRINFSYNRQLSNSFTYRLRFFHVSSHLGDDFIIRNGINSYTENKVNYEQLEFTLFKTFNQTIRSYAGFGSVVRPNSIRLPFSYHLGSDWVKKRKEKGWTLTAGLMLKGFQETDFNTNLKLGAGVGYFTPSKREPFRLVVEYYQGQLPYSQFEQETIEWIGLGLYFYLQ